MKTLVLIAHPELKDSGSQQFLHDSLSGLDQVTWRILDPKLNFNVKTEQQLLIKNDRIIFQFPLYWYSAPAILKQWEDDVLTRAFTYPEEDGNLSGKDLGIVTTLGIPERQYQPGALENYSLAELLRPYQALADRAKMNYLTPFVVDQFSYMDPEQKAALLVNYRQYVTAKNVNGFKSRQQFIKTELKKIKEPNDKLQMMVNLINDQVSKNEVKLADLKSQIDLIKRQEE